MNVASQDAPCDGASPDHEHLQLLLEINNALVTTLELHELFRAISSSLGRVIQHDYSSLSLYVPELRHFRVYALDFPGGRGLIHEEVVFKLEDSPAGQAFTSRQPLALGDLDPHRFPSDITKWLLDEGIQSACWIPLLRGERCLGALCVARRSRSDWPAADIRLLTETASQVAIAVENALAFQQIKDLKDKLSHEKTYLEGEIQAHYNDGEMIGASPEWQRVLQAIATVAPTDANVLILGETGTGKELVARAIHRQSTRRERTFVKLNCSAVPSGLLESELFGHRKGAFTGAISDQIGRFELAHRGTLLLDEIGDIPLELQPKLLRALQEQQFERLGNPRTIQVDVRVIASTNRDLAEMVRQRQFRDDLYYRLNVFPIVIPPLRERRADIPLLVRYFVQKHASRMRRQVHTIPPESMKLLVQGDWPGNVRELENVVERAVILSTDGTLRPILAESRPSRRRAEFKPLDEAERDHILKALRACRGMVGGADGAAAMLNMKRTTLNSRMRKLGLSRMDVMQPE
jgi:formate hydrogenlyase transcriptional activator